MNRMVLKGGEVAKVLDATPLKNLPATLIRLAGTKDGRYALRAYKHYLLLTDPARLVP